MKGIEDMQFYCAADRDGKFTSRVRKFDDLRSRPHRSRLDALDEIISLTARRIADIDSNKPIKRTREGSA